jgi:hypothetical protein
MQLSFTAEEEAFRAQVREFFEHEYPQSGGVGPTR